MGAVELHVISCERPLFSGKVDAVFAKSPVGWFGILPRHAPATFLLQDSPLRVKTAEGERVFFVRRGVLHVQENVVTVVADEIRSA